MTCREDRMTLMAEISEACAAGARLAPACSLAGIDLRSFQRWRAADGEVKADRRPEAVRPRPTHALSEAERARLIELANEPRFADTPPARIVPALADEGIYVASEASFHRVLGAHGQLQHRGRARPPRSAGPPSTHVATAPGQVWCWDVTFLNARVQGRWFYLYLILDLFSRKIVGFEVHDTDQAEHAAHLVRRTALAEGVHARAVRPVLHGDNGPSVKATTVAAMLHWLGISPSAALAPAGERRQCLRRGVVPHRQVPPRLPHRGLRRPPRGAAVGGRLRALVQPRAPAQRHPLRQPGAAACRRGRPHPRRPPGAVPAGARGQSAPLERAAPPLDPDRRRPPQPRARRRRGRSRHPNPAFRF